MSKINKVLYNVDQRSDNAAETDWLWMARHNIGLDDNHETGGVIGKATTTDASGKKTCGIAPLGENGLVPAEFLPTFVDQVVNGYYYNNKFYEDDQHTQEITPNTNSTYVDITVADRGVGYRWTQASGYFEIANQNAFGAIQAFNGSTAAGTIHADQPMDILQVKGSQGIKVGASDSGHTDALTIEHTNQVTAGTIGSSSASSGITLAVPYANYDANGHITGKGTHTHTIPDAGADKGVVALQDSIAANESCTTKAVTPHAVRVAIDNLDNTPNGTSGTGTNVTVKVIQTKGTITGVTVTDDTAKASHAHGNITSDGKVTESASAYNKLLVTNSSNQITVGPVFGTATTDAKLFLNKKGDWTNIPTATSSDVGGIKIGYSESGTNYAVKLSDGKAYVKVPWTDTDTKNTVGVGNLSTSYPGTSDSFYIPFVLSPSSGDASAQSYTSYGPNSNALLRIAETSDHQGYLLRFDGSIVPSMASSLSTNALLTFQAGKLNPSGQAGDDDYPIYLDSDGVPQVCDQITRQFTYTVHAASASVNTIAKRVELDEATHQLIAFPDDISSDSRKHRLGYIAPDVADADHSATIGKVLTYTDNGAVWDVGGKVARGDIAYDLNQTTTGYILREGDAFYADDKLYYVNNEWSLGGYSWNTVDSSEKSSHTVKIPLCSLSVAGTGTSKDGIIERMIKMWIPSAGSGTANHLVKFDSSGHLVDAGFGISIGSSGSAADILYFY